MRFTPETLSAAHNRASNLRVIGQYQQARDALEDTLARCRRVLGQDHPDTLTSAHRLTYVLRRLGEHDKARMLHEDTLTRRRRVLHDQVRPSDPWSGPRAGR